MEPRHTALRTSCYHDNNHPPPRPPAELVLRFWFTEGRGGGCAIVNDGTWLGTGSAARNPSRTQVEEESFKSGHFRPENNIIATPLLLYIFFGPRTC